MVTTYLTLGRVLQEIILLINGGWLAETKQVSPAERTPIAALSLLSARMVFAVSNVAGSWWWQLS